ncbi:hypothetical protein B0H12DRAFT_544171 [Mycena haematopus]|nr:hypothetical protein B0H12DRAFT_544171 [Mycena haematopus]
MPRTHVDLACNRSRPRSALPTQPRLCSQTRRGSCLPVALIFKREARSTGPVVRHGSGEMTIRRMESGQLREPVPSPPIRKCTPRQTSPPYAVYTFPSLYDLRSQQCLQWSTPYALQIYLTFAFVPPTALLPHFRGSAAYPHPMARACRIEVLLLQHRTDVR